MFAQIRATRLFGNSHGGASGGINQLGSSVAGSNQAQNHSTMASRRQDAWEAQLNKEKAVLVATTKPIIDDTATFKPPIPYALREVKRSMDKGVYFKDNTRGRSNEISSNVNDEKQAEKNREYSRCSLVTY